MSLNWVDVVFIFFIGGCGYIGSKSGLINEFFKILGIFLATFLSVHYYVHLGKILNEHFLIDKLYQEVSAFLLISVLVYLLFFLMREGWAIILKFELPKWIDQWTGLILGFVRGYLIVGILFIALMISGVSFLHASAKNSFGSLIFRNASLGIYQVCYGKFMSPLFPGEKINEKAFKIFEEEDRKE